MATKHSSPSLPISQSGKSKGTPPPFFTCLYTNASSIKGNTRVEKLNDLTTRITNNMPDLIGISETGFTYVQAVQLQADPAEEYLRGQLTDYNVFVCNIGEGRGRRSDVQRGPQSRAGTYGGVALCIREKLSPGLVNFANIPNPSYVDQVWCTVTLESGETGLVGCIYQLVLTNDVYTSNNAAANKEIKQAFTNAKEFVKKNNLKFLLIMGDFNNPNLKWDVDSDCLKISNPSHQRENDFENMLLMHDLTQWVKKPTFPSHTSLGFLIEHSQDSRFKVTVLSKLMINKIYRIEKDVSETFEHDTLRSYEGDDNDNDNNNVNHVDCLLNEHKYNIVLEKSLGNTVYNSNNSEPIHRNTVKKILKDCGLEGKLTNQQWRIVGDFQYNNDKKWPKKVKLNNVEFEVDLPIGNILDLLITNEGATIDQLEQYDPLGEKTGHSVLTFECRINGDDAVENLCEKFSTLNNEEMNNLKINK